MKDAPNVPTPNRKQRTFRLWHLFAISCLMLIAGTIVAALIPMHWGAVADNLSLLGAGAGILAIVAYKTEDKR